jgi:hypothetical protein
LIKFRNFWDTFLEIFLVKKKVIRWKHFNYQNKRFYRIKFFSAHKNCWVRGGIIFFTAKRS